MDTVLDYFKQPDPKLPLKHNNDGKTWLRDNQIPDLTTTQDQPNVLALFAGGKVTSIPTTYGMIPALLIHLKPLTKVYRTPDSENKVSKYTFKPNNTESTEVLKLEIGAQLGISPSIHCVLVNHKPLIIWTKVFTNHHLGTDKAALTNYNNIRNYNGLDKHENEDQIPSNSYIENHKNYELRSLRSHINYIIHDLIPPYVRKYIILEDVETTYIELDTNNELISNKHITPERLYLPSILQIGK